MAEKVEKETYICMDHNPSWIFKTAHPNPVCPLCKLSDYVSVYSGDRKPVRKGKANGKDTEDSKDSKNTKETKVTKVTKKTKGDASERKKKAKNQMSIM